MIAVSKQRIAPRTLVLLEVPLKMLVRPSELCRMVLQQSKNVLFWWVVRLAGPLRSSPAMPLLALVLELVAVGELLVAVALYPTLLV